MDFLITITDGFNYYAAIFAFIFITLDVASGMMKGASQHALSSKVMRQGFWHKSALFLVIILSALVDSAMRSGLDIGFNAPIFEGACVYVCVMEIISILENVSVMNPELKSSKLFAMFAHVNREKTTEEDEAE